MSWLLTLALASVGWLVVRQHAARLAALEASLDEAPRACPHNEVTNVGTFGLPEYRCEQCGAMVSDDHES
jgi:hypothetical protein